MVLLALLPVTLAATSMQQRGLTFETALKSVAIFRDGYGYYVREGKVKLENGWATTNFVPSAIRGTFWIYSLDKDDRIDTIVTTKDNLIDFANAADLKAKLADKIGLRLSIIAQNGQKFEGELARLLDDMLLLQAGTGFSAVPYAQIKSVSILGFPIKVKVATSNLNKTTTLGIAYLQEGIRWEPSYVLNVSGKTGTLELRASLLNTTESLKNSDVMFVVGSPYVTNRGMTDMMGTVPGMAFQLDKDGGQVPAKADVAGIPGGGGRGGGFRGESPTPTVSGEEAGELFYYKKPGLTLATNDVAMVSIFRSQIEVTPKFEWNADGEEIIYLLSLKNSTKQPLTTGSVLVIEDGKALGQESIKYTPPDASAEVRLSRGIGLRVEKTEAEVKRGASVKIGKSEFIPVTLKGSLTITNFRQSEADIKVTRTVRGRVTSQSDSGRVKQTQVLSGEVNPTNDLEWVTKVPAGQTKVLTYTVETLIFADRAGTPPVPEKPGDGG